MFDNMVQVKHTGQVLYVPSYKFRSLCVVAEGSEDSPECPLTFGSWIHNSGRLHLFSSSERADAAFYVQNLDYELYTMNSVSLERTYKCCPDETYGDLTYTIRLRRRPKEDEGEGQEESAAMREVSLLLPALAAALSLLANNL